MTRPAQVNLPTLDPLDYDATSHTDEELVMDLLAPHTAVTRERAAEVLRACRGLAGLPTAEPAGMIGEGVSPDEAVVLLAALEIGRRLAEQEVPRFRPLERLPAVVAFLALRYPRHTQEVMGSLFLDRRQRLVHHEVFYRGTLSRAAVEPRAILKEAIRRRATGIVLFHTHPSGDPCPSLEDLAFTRRMAQAAGFLDMELLDHLVIGGVQRWVSLRERGCLSDPG